MALYLVTGGCGFIGSHLCEALRARGDAVRVLDDLSTGRIENLAPGAELVRGSITDPGAVAAATADVQGCFHLAAIASVERGVQDPLGTHAVNQTGTIRILDALRQQPGQPAMVYASSAAVYGDCRTLPITEDVERRPLSAYGADKYGCELHARVATHLHGLPTVGLRFFNVYGPRQDPRSPYSGVISIFADRLSRGEGVGVFGDGLQTRDFVHVGDVVAALLAAMALRPAEARAYNVCTGRAISVLDLAALIAELCNIPLDLRHLPPRAGEIRDSVGSPVRSRQDLGLGEPRALRDGLADLLAYAPA